MQCSTFHLCSIHIYSSGNLMVKHQFQQNVLGQEVFIVHVSAAVYGFKTRTDVKLSTG